MKAILWKEFRENFKWAALAMLVLALAEFYVLSEQRHGFQDSNGSDITLCSTTFLMVTSFGCVAAGVFLGVMQILPELKRDRWAALLHRPVSRGVIFFGKVLAGSLLYFFATTLPFLASICYVAVPCEFPAPLVPGMTLPGVNDLLIGAAFYFVAMLICLQRGRWFGTRGALLAAAVAVFIFHIESDTPAFLLPLAAAAVTLLAAWGAMISEGSVGERPWPGRLAFVALVFIGAQAVVLLAMAGLHALPGQKEVANTTFVQLLVTKEGQVLRASYSGEYASSVVTDLDGKPVTDEGYTGSNSYANLCEFTPLESRVRPGNGVYDFTRRGYRNGNTYLEPLRLNGVDKENWYLLIKQNYFIGYDTLSHRCIGICDREGFKPAGAKPVPFGGVLYKSFFSRTQPTLFWTDSQLYAFAIPERQMTPLLHVSGDMIYDALPIPNDFDTEKPKFVVILLDKEIRLIDTQGQVLSAFPCPHDPWKWTSLSVATNPAVDRLYLQSAIAWYELHPGMAPLPDFLDELDLHGHSLHTYSQPAPAVAAPISGWTTVLSTYLMPLAPILVGSLSHHAARPSFFDTSSIWWSDLIVPSIRWEIFVVIALVLAVLAFRQARDNGLSRGAVWRWMIFVFAFGPAGWLTFRLASDCPTRVRCPDCGHKRPVTTENCRYCQHPWAPPTATGTEIFEPRGVDA